MTDKNLQTEFQEAQTEFSEFNEQPAAFEPPFPQQDEQPFDGTFTENGGFFDSRGFSFTEAGFDGGD